MISMRRTCFTVALGGVTAWGSVAHAQTAAPQDAASGVALEEVVVTAQKRSETILSVPISITAMSQETLDREGIKDLNDIARNTPSLTISSNNGLGYSNVSIRGITSATGAATTGLYIDDTPIQERNDSLGPPVAPQVFDLDRIEVLRGPQGTLFGAGSEGGTIRYITPGPNYTSPTLRSRAEVAYTDMGAPTYEAGLAGGVPLIEDQLAVRASAWYRSPRRLHRPGFPLHRAGARSQLQWQLHPGGTPGGGMGGYREPFNAAQLKSLYPTHQEYVAKVRASVTDLVNARWLTRQDGERIITAAAAAPVP